MNKEKLDALIMKVEDEFGAVSKELAELREQVAKAQQHEQKLVARQIALSGKMEAYKGLEEVEVKNEQPEA